MPCNKTPYPDRLLRFILQISPTHLLQSNYHQDFALLSCRTTENEFHPLQKRMYNLINIFMKITLYPPYEISHAVYHGPRQSKPIAFFSIAN